MTPATERELLSVLSALAVQVDSMLAIISRQQMTSIPDYGSGFRIVETAISVPQNVPKVLAMASPDRVFLEIGTIQNSVALFISTNALTVGSVNGEIIGSAANSKRYDIWHQPALVQAQWNGFIAAAGGGTAIVKEVLYQRNKV
jgi:hypothetical protein